MDHPPLPRDSRVNVTWARICCIAAVLICATVGGVVLAEYSEPFEESSIQVAHQHLADTISDQDSGCLGAIIAAGGGTREPNTTTTTRGMQQQQLEVKNGWGTDTLVSLRKAAAAAAFSCSTKASWWMHARVQQQTC